jgi:hypothetical protein
MFVMPQYRSRMAFDIEVSQDAFIVSASGLNSSTILHLPQLGVLHYISLVDDEDNMVCFEDLRDILSDTLRSNSFCDDRMILKEESLTMDDVLRNRQAELFIDLILDVRKNSTSSLELATPVLHALQMLLKSEWQPSNSFPSEFLEVLVSLLNSEVDNRQTLNTVVTSGNSSSSPIAKSLLSTILKKQPQNTEYILDVLFGSFRQVKPFLYHNAQISIISQTLGSYLNISLATAITHSVQKTNLSSEHELFGMIKLKADAAWRLGLVLGDTVETHSRSPIEGFNSSSTTTSWMKACIVRIDYKADMFTLESCSPQHLLRTTLEAPSRLIHVARGSVLIRPLNTTMNNEIASGKYNSHATTSNFMTSDATFDGPEIIYGEGGVQFFVGKSHKHIIDLVFDSTEVFSQHGLGVKRSAKDIYSKVEQAPKCLSCHDMAIVSLGEIAESFRLSHFHFICDRCESSPSFDKSKSPRGWYCDTCDHHICFSCHPEIQGLTQFLFLHGPSDSTLAQIYSGTGHPRNGSMGGFRSGDIIEVNTPSSKEDDDPQSLERYLNENTRDKFSGLDYYRLTDGSGFASKHPGDGWSWHIIPTPPLRSNSTPEIVNEVDSTREMAFPSIRGLSSPVTSSESLTPTSSPFVNIPSSSPLIASFSHTPFINPVPLSFSDDVDFTYRSNLINRPERLRPNLELVDLIGLIVKLDKARKEEISNQQSMPVEEMKDAKLAGKLIVSLQKGELLNCALVVFEKVGIRVSSLCSWFLLISLYLSIHKF